MCPPNIPKKTWPSTNNSVHPSCVCVCVLLFVERFVVGLLVKPKGHLVEGSTELSKSVAKSHLSQVAFTLPLIGALQPDGLVVEGSFALTLHSNEFKSKPPGSKQPATGSLIHAFPLISLPACRISVFVQLFGSLKTVSFISVQSGEKPPPRSPGRR